MRRLWVVLLLAVSALLLVPAAVEAAITTFGSPLSSPATLNTAKNLDYEGIYTPVVPGSLPESSDGYYHTNHYGTDTAIWNVALADGAPSVPATGQAVNIKLEGCAEPASGGPAPLTQIHFQDITPLSGGGAKVNLTSQAFEIPVCGQSGASGSTITTYEPINLCVSKGDYVAFNDEGGYVPYTYQSGVPYEVLGATHGTIADSFIKPNGTDNGDSMPSSERSAAEGFAENQNEELMMQVELGTGPDATHICPGGTGGLPKPLPPLRISPQTDGINRARIVTVAMFCRFEPACKGTATVTYAGKSVGHTTFSIRPETTSHVPIRLAPKMIGLIRKHHGVTTTVTAVVNGQTFPQKLFVKIF
jgi:hypothetical protein